MQAVLTERIQKALEALGISDVSPELEYPAELSHGDFATNVAMVAAKNVGKNPRDLAEEIKKTLGDIDGVEKIEIAGPGFINFHLSPDFFRSTVFKIIAAGDVWGNNEFFKGRKVIVEYSQPNPFKQFHIGHLMSTTIGESISRLVEWSGASIFRANYGGDVGPHVAKTLWGLQKHSLDPENVEDLGNAYVLGNTAYEEDEAAKAEIDSLNKRIYAQVSEGNGKAKSLSISERTQGESPTYASDPELKDLYDAGRETSIRHFEDIYKVMGTKFDRSFYESETAPIGTELVKEGLKKGVFEESDGAVVYKGEKTGLHTRVFLTSQGTPTYEAKEIGFVKLKSETFPFDLNVTTIAIEQDSYFKVVEAAIAELMPHMKGKYTHVAFGLMQLSSGKMSSRKGNVVTGESLIEDMRRDALLKMKDRDLGSKENNVADAVAIAAIKYSILKQARGKNIIFDPEASLSFEGDSGPYLQYSYVRARSIVEKAVAAGKEKHIIYDKISLPDAATTFERLLPRFPAIVERAVQEYEPHYMTTYLTHIASSFNAWYAGERILGSGHEAYKLALTEAFATTMKNGLWLLGIQVPEKM